MVQQEWSCVNEIISLIVRILLEIKQKNILRLPYIYIYIGLIIYWEDRPYLKFSIFEESVIEWV